MCKKSLLLLTKAILVSLRIYKRTISPLLPAACRFYPSCSEYALSAISKYGVCHGSFLSLKRLCKCHPFHAGGYDPVA